MPELVHEPLYGARQWHLLELLLAQNSSQASLRGIGVQPSSFTQRAELGPEVVWLLNSLALLV